MRRLKEAFPEACGTPPEPEWVLNQMIRQFGAFSGMGFRKMI
jgi:hypothetical protein